MPEHYSSPFFHTRAFSLTKNEKPLAVGSGSTDIILPLSRVNQHLLRYSSVNIVQVYVF